MSKEAILGIIRHVCTFGGGFVAEKGLASSDEVTTAVAALVTLVGLVWSVLNKRKK